MSRFNKVTVKVVKNKVAPPFKIAQVDIMYGVGISRIGELIDLAVDNDIIQKSGSWMSYKAEKIGQGRDAVKAYLEANPVIADTVMTELKAKLSLIAEEKRAN